MRRISAVVRNFGGVAASVVAEAQAIVNDIYQPIGVEIRWLTQEQLRMELPAAPVSPCAFTSLVVVNLVARPMEDELPPDVMATTVPGARYVRVAVHRIEQRAAIDGATFGFLLGQVLAHEIGHVLLPRSAHAIDGLMKETLDVRLAMEERLVIFPEQAAAMRTTIVDKLHGCR